MKQTTIQDLIDFLQKIENKNAIICADTQDGASYDINLENIRFYKKGEGKMLKETTMDDGDCCEIEFY